MLGSILLLSLTFLTFAAHAQTFPAFTGLVTDAANVLPADRKAALEAKLAALQQQTGHQLVVATVPDLQGYDIADYGYRLGRAWGVGLKGANNGAILIVAPKERKVRVEVGYGLEGVVTDAISSVVVNQTILPRFKAGDLPGGIEAGADALDRQLRLPDDQAKAKAAAAAEYDKTHRRSRNGDGFPIGAIIWIAVIVGAVALASRGGGGGRRRAFRGGGGSNWPIWLWAASELMQDRGRSSGGGGIFGGDGGSSGGGLFGGGSDGSWGGGGFTGGGGGSFGGGGASGDW